MARLQNEDINRVRASANISDVISQYIPIEKKGRNFVAICPFHDDTNPSMSISEEKQIYKCFVCGAGGNVFTFVANYTNVSFVQSVAEVAKLVNIPLDIEVSAPVEKVNYEYQNYYTIMDEATNFLHYQLINSQEDIINNYVKQRDLNQTDLEYFNVGYETDHKLVNFLNKKGYENSDLIKINLINEFDYGVRSVFNNRLIFPIHNSNAQVVGYSARAIVNDENVAKYINSNENIIYTKGDVLYNYHRALQSAKNDNIVYLVEGVMDVIGFYKAGVLNSVASLGTALTENQVKLLKSLSTNVVLSYDGDSAGLLATVKAIELLLKHNFTIEVLVGFNDEDPDDYLKNHGKEDFNRAIKERIGYLDFLIKYYKVKYNLDNFEERKEYTITLVKYLDYIRNEFDKEYFLNQIVNSTNFSKDQILQLKLPSTSPNIIKQTKRRESGLLSNRAEYNIIGQMLSGKEASLYIRDNLGFLTDQNLYAIFLILVDYFFENEKISEADLISVVSQIDENLSDLFLSILNNSNIIKEYDKAIIDENIVLIQTKLIDEEIRDLSQIQYYDEKERAENIFKIAALKRQKAELLHKKE